MAEMDIFTQDAFTMGELTDTVERVPYQPTLIGSLNLFRPVPVRTEFVAIEERDRTLAIIPTTERGAPLPQGRGRKRRLRRFDTVRLAKGDRVNAAEIQGIRAFGSETELMQVQEVVTERQMTLRDDLELTFEVHRLGALQGVVLDADGSTIINWFDEYGITAPTPIEFKLDTSTTEVERVCRNVLRAVARASKGLWRPGSYVAALCGDSFFDKLTSHKTVKDTYLNTAQANALRNAFGVAADTIPQGSFAAYWYGGILFINYRGVDDFADNAGAGTVQSIGIKSTEAKFFPVNAPGVFQVARSPAETFDYVNTPGREVYSMLLPDRKRNAYVDLEVYAYPLYMCTRPEMLMRAVENTN